ncbi:EAL domain-containing protein, partial [Vibrio sp. 1074]|uniref:EAL domain-containing protein n=1 Tax=Vibrio sp. 1074 TaxID=3074542 RepID=UPI002964E6BB
LGHTANCEVLAEGIETQAEYELVAQCGVDTVQGFYLAKPMPRQDLSDERA